MLTKDDPANLEDMLRAQGLADAALDRARAVADRTGDRLEVVLVQLGLLPEDRLVGAYAKLSGLEVAPRRAFPEQAVDVAPASTEFLKMNRILPLYRDEAGLHVAVSDPWQGETLDVLSHAIGAKVHPLLTAKSDIEAALATLYAPQAKRAIAGAGEDDYDRLRDLASEEPIIRLANDIVELGMRAGASDIHLEPRSDGMHLRLRVDGILRPERIILLSDAPALVSRLKIMARLDISERRLPQDGRIRATTRGREADLRVSTVPSLEGEAVVMRILDRDMQPKGLDSLGYQDRALADFRQILSRPNGIVLLTGPTGSGKTTTLYAALQEIMTPEVKVLTVEDPVEYRLEDAVQVQVKPEIGLTFAAALRAFLRHDPNIVMLGEIRDRETAEIAMQTALAGRLVLSTLHANSALAAVTRLTDIGIEPYLVSSVVQGVAAQRLVRRLCPTCKTSIEPESALADTLAGYGGQPMRAVGCADCRQTGYAGRFAITEVVPFGPEIRAAVSHATTAQELEALARDAGLRSLQEAGFAAVANGDTSYEEVMRAAGET